MSDIADSVAEYPTVGTVDGDDVALTVVTSPIGQLLAGADGFGICILEFASSDPHTQLARLSHTFRGRFVRSSTPATELLEHELVSYFAGTLQTFSVPISLNGTTFQKSVWGALRQIPYGQTRSYGDQAASLGKLKAVRAVGHANGQNPVSIVVPCHRVIGADGSLTGYGGGLWRKKWLLRHEGATFRDPDLQTTLDFG